LQQLTEAANGLIMSPADHRAVDAARRELSALTAQITQARRDGPGPASDLAGLCARALAHLPDRDGSAAMTTILAGWQSAVPVTTTLLAEILAQPREVRLACGDPAAVHGAVREALRRSAHFTWVTPGPLTAPLQAGQLNLPAGTLVLPVIHAACLDPAYAGPDPAAFRLDRPRRPVLAFGAGAHRCPAYALMTRVLAAATRAAVTAGVHLAPANAEVPLNPGLIAAPPQVPVVLTRKPRHS
jgi:mycocyclosin synthase